MLRKNNGNGQDDVRGYDGTRTNYDGHSDCITTMNGVDNDDVDNDSHEYIGLVAFVYIIVSQISFVFLQNEGTGHCIVLFNKGWSKDSSPDNC